MEFPAKKQVELTNYNEAELWLLDVMNGRLVEISDKQLAAAKALLGKQSKVKSKTEQKADAAKNAANNWS